MEKIVEKKTIFRTRRTFTLTVNCIVLLLFIYGPINCVSGNPLSNGEPTRASIKFDDISRTILIQLSDTTPAAPSKSQPSSPSSNSELNNFIINDKQILVLPTFSLNDCSDVKEPLPIIKRNTSTSELIVSFSDFSFDNQQEAYLCLISVNSINNEKSVQHLGLESTFFPPSLRHRRDVDFSTVRNEPNPQKNYEKAELVPKESASKVDTTTPVTISTEIRIDAIRIEKCDRDPSYTEDGVPELFANSKALFRFTGVGFSNRTIVTLTEVKGQYGSSCILPASGQFRAIAGSVQRNTILVEMTIPKGLTFFYFCTKNAEEDESNNLLLNGTNPFMHQGSEDWLRIRSYENLLPVWVSIIIIVGCLCFSALFSGLNLGLMSLDRTELKILKSTGVGKEREYAAIIQPIRDHGNYLLCSILLGNVLVNSTFTILLDGLTSGLIAVIFSTLLIVIFGEITPQAVCSRHALFVGANTIWITKIVMALTFPLSYPTSLFLNWVLGEEIGAVYNRERLKELVKVTNDVNDLDKDEVNIISGALELRKKSVADVMTHIDDVFMLSYDAILDFETVSEIMKSGFSRIPVYESDRQNVLTLLFIKDLAFVDPDDNTPLRTLCEFYQNSCHFVFEDVTLDVMFKRFKEGNRGHMAFVHRVNSSGDGDPFYETVGLITLEDVIEELIQSEIVDETDVYTDNRTKVRRNKMKKHDFTIFAERRENHHIRISPQLTLATFQYLTTTVDAFKSDIVSETILRRLLNQDIVHQIKYKGKEKDDPSLIIFQQGKAVDYFVLILEGRVEVTVGRESLMFESGPFTYFGTQALVQNVGVIDSPQQIKGSLQSLNMDAMLRHSFIPDYSVKAVSDVFYITIKRTLYLAAKRATLMERAQKTGELTTNEPIDDEVEKLLHSLDGEDDRSIKAHTVTLNANTPRASKPTSKTPSPSEMLNTTDITINGLPLDETLRNQRNSADDSSAAAPLLPK